MLNVPCDKALIDNNSIRDLIGRRNYICFPTVNLKWGRKRWYVESSYLQHILNSCCTVLGCGFWNLLGLNFVHLLCLILPFSSFCITKWAYMVLCIAELICSTALHVVHINPIISIIQFCLGCKQMSHLMWFWLIQVKAWDKRGVAVPFKTSSPSQMHFCSLANQRPGRAHSLVHLSLKWLSIVLNEP